MSSFVIYPYYSIRSRSKVQYNTDSTLLHVCSDCLNFSLTQQPGAFRTWSSAPGQGPTVPSHSLVSLRTCRRRDSYRRERIKKDIMMASNPRHSPRAKGAYGLIGIVGCATFPILGEIPTFIGISEVESALRSLHRRFRILFAFFIGWISRPARPTPASLAGPITVLTSVCDLSTVGEAVYKVTARRESFPSNPRYTASRSPSLSLYPVLRLLASR